MPTCRYLKRGKINKFSRGRLKISNVCALAWKLDEVKKKLYYWTQFYWPVFFPQTQHTNIPQFFFASNIHSPMKLPSHYFEQQILIPPSVHHGLDSSHSEIFLVFCFLHYYMYMYSVCTNNVSLYNIWYDYKIKLLLLKLYPLLIDH